MKMKKFENGNINIKLESDAAVEEFMKTCKFKP